MGLRSKEERRIDRVRFRKRYRSHINKNKRARVRGIDKRAIVPLDLIKVGKKSKISDVLLSIKALASFRKGQKRGE